MAATVPMQSVKDLMKKKDNLEAEIKELNSVLETVSKPVQENDVRFT